MPLRWSLILAIVLLVFTGLKCNRPGPELKIDFKYEYFPLQEGSAWIYDVDSIIINRPGRADSLISFQRRWFIESTFEDAGGRTAYRIEVDRRADESRPWVNEAVWFANRTNTTAEIVVENMRFINLIFPPKTNEYWKGNAHINYDTGDCLPDYDDWDYRVEALDEPWEINNLFFDSTLTVLQINDTTENLLKGQYSLERYAKGVGLIEKEFWSFETKEIKFVPWYDRADCGFVFRMKINSFTK